MSSRVELLTEPEVVGGARSSAFCKNALLEGPFSGRSRTHLGTLPLGVVGPKALVDTMRAWIAKFNAPIESISTRPDASQVNKDLFPDFPGARVAFATDFISDDSLTEHITVNELSRLERGDPRRYMDGLLELYANKISAILDRTERKPRVIVCVLSDEMFNICHNISVSPRRRPLGDVNQLNLFGDFDLFLDRREDVDLAARNLRSALKKSAMKPELGVPLQIVREQTLEDPTHSGGQNLATRTWNICTGLFYKGGQLPWVLKSLERETCFLGISHYRRQTTYTNQVHTSMAHLFSNDFEGVVIRGSRMSYDYEKRSPYLNRDQARELLDKALCEYTKIRGSAPARLVVHKTSLYSDDEIAGYSDVLRNLNVEYDLVSLAKSGLRLIRKGRYPVLRGSYCELDGGIHFLYTKGYVPELGTYPGVHVPVPFMVSRPAGDSSYRQVCEEVLALTKLNWNSADFCSGLPITVGFARNVGLILKEFDESTDLEPARSYRYYM